MLRHVIAAIQYRQKNSIALAAGELRRHHRLGRNTFVNKGDVLNQRVRIPEHTLTRRARHQLVCDAVLRRQVAMKRLTCRESLLTRVAPKRIR